MYHVRKMLLLVGVTLFVLPLAGCYYHAKDFPKTYIGGFQKTYDVAVERKYDFPITYRTKEVIDNEENSNRNTMASTVYIEPSILINHNF